MSRESSKAEVYTRYPLSSILVYNGATILHFLLGGIGMMVGYRLSWASYLSCGLYLAFSFIEMYVMMPLTVCPNCVYYRMENSRCISGMNVISRKVAKEGNPKDFPKRGDGLFCNNNLYVAALAFPILAMIPALVLNFSFLLLAIFLAVMGLLLSRFFVIFKKIACVHCRAKYTCPQAGSLGVRDM